MADYWWSLAAARTDCDVAAAGTGSGLCAALLHWPLATTPDGSKSSWGKDHLTKRRLRKDPKGADQGGNPASAHVGFRITVCTPDVMCCTAMCGFKGPDQTTVRPCRGAGWARNVTPDTASSLSSSVCIAGQCYLHRQDACRGARRCGTCGPLPHPSPKTRPPKPGVYTVLRGPTVSGRLIATGGPPIPEPCQCVG